MGMVGVGGSGSRFESDECDHGDGNLVRGSGGRVVRAAGSSCSELGRVSGGGLGGWSSRAKG